MIQSNQLICLYKFEDELTTFINRYDILLIYDSHLEILVILSFNQLMRFLIYNTDIVKYTFISLYNNNQYENVINENIKKYLISRILETFNNIGVNTKYLNQLISYLSIDADINSDTNLPVLTLKIINQTYMNPKLFYVKYIKYKNKYLNLVKENS